MKRIFLAVAAVAAFAALPVFAGEYHVGPTLVCYDCHTPHFSMQHGYDATHTSVITGTGGGQNGNWLGATGPNQYLLKAPGASAVCLSCHDGQTFAPDVMKGDTNAGSTLEGRSAGALNEVAASEGYQPWMGHTIDSVGLPPGYNSTIPGSLSGTNALTPASVLECTSCHVTHGSAPAYRNLGNRTLTSTQPTFTVSTTSTDPCVNAINNQTGIITTAPPLGTNGCDVWINITQASYASNSGSAATFGPYYDTKNVFYNRNDVAGSGATAYSNKMDQFCGMCHSAFHGGPDSVSGNQSSAPSVAPFIPAIGSDAAGFLRHPTGTVSLGSGITSLSQYQGGLTRVKTYDVGPRSDTGTTANTQMAVGCVSCHKAHGNGNPFGLVFMARQKGVASPNPINEQGAWNPADVQTTATGYRNLCGQCHSLGN